MKPSLKVVKETVKDWEIIWQKSRSEYTENYVRAGDLAMDFLRFFIALRENQSHFDFNGVFKRLSDNADQYPGLRKALDLIHNDYMAGKIDIDRKKFPDISALEDYKGKRLEQGDNPAINRAAVNRVNVDGGTPTGLITPQLAKKPVFKSNNGVSLPYDVKGKIMSYADPAAQPISEMSDQGKKKWKEERGKSMARTEAANIQKVASNQNDTVQIHTMQPDEVQIDTMQKPKDHSFNQQDESMKYDGNQSLSTLDQSIKPDDSLDQKDGFMNKVVKLDQSLDQ